MSDGRCPRCARPWSSDESRWKWTRGERELIKRMHAAVYGGRADDVDIDAVGDNKSRHRLLVEAVAMLEDD